MRISHFALKCGLLELVGVLLVPCLISSKAENPCGRVVIVLERNRTFSPNVVTIHCGEEVVWKNDGTTSVAIIGDPLRAKFEIDIQPPAPPEPFHSDQIAPGEVFSRRFTLDGVYRYVSDRYEDEGMNGVLIVVPAREDLPAPKPH